MFTNQHGYVPFAVLDPSSTGRQTREGSRTIEVLTLQSHVLSPALDGPSHFFIASMHSMTSEFARLPNSSDRTTMSPSIPIGPTFVHHVLFIPFATCPSHVHDSGTEMCGMPLSLATDSKVPLSTTSYFSNGLPIVSAVNPLQAFPKNDGQMAVSLIRTLSTARLQTPLPANALFSKTT